MKTPSLTVQRTKTWVAVSALALCGGFSPAAQAAFVIVEDFDTLTDGAIDGQNGWTANSSNKGTMEVLGTSPFSPSDKGLSNGTNAGSDSPIFAYKNLGGSIDTGTTGTVFFQIHITDFSSATSFGIADTNIDSASPFNSYRSQLAFTVDGNFTVRNGGSSTTLDQTLATGVVYNFWIVSNNASQTSQIYVQGGAFDSQTQLTSAGGTVDSFAYRSNEGHDDLTHFLVAKSTPANSSDESLFFDNIYFDGTGVNLANPVAIPEPGAYAAFAGVGALMACFFRRRRRNRPTT